MWNIYYFALQYEWKVANSMFFYYYRFALSKILKENFALCHKNVAFCHENFAFFL